MKEKDLVDSILKSGFLENKYGIRNIQEIHREYSVGNGKNVDLVVETLDFLYLIEVKVSLSAYDIGQIMTYMVAVKPKTFKRIKGALLYSKIAPNELKLINNVINDFNIDIELIEYAVMKSLIEYEEEEVMSLVKKPKKKNYKNVIEKIREYLILNNLQGKQFPTHKVTEFMGCKRHEIDSLKPELLKSNVIYKANEKSYKVKEDI